MSNNHFSLSQLDFLRNDVKKFFGTEYRYLHTLGVEREAIRLGKLFAPEKIPVLQAAALLHDITKENSFEKQLQICENKGIIITNDQKIAKKTLHAITAAQVIPSLYPEFAVAEVLEAVRFHTTGRADMGICEKLIYLADYIEENRTFEDCVSLRKSFWDKHPEGMTFSDALYHLNDVLILSFDMTIRQLISDGYPIDASTMEARNFLILEKTDKIKRV